MQPSKPTLAGTILLTFFYAILQACITDDVPEDIYASSGSPTQGGGPPPSATNSGGTGQGGTGDRGTTGQADATGSFDVGSSTGAMSAGTGDTGKPAGPADAACDLRGDWLITQRMVAEGLGVKQAALYWLYYQIEQNGSDLNVTKGLVCGGQVQPIDLLAATVDYKAAWPQMVEKNSHAGRRGRITSTGSGCEVSFDRIYVVIGATTPHYADGSHALPTVDQPASGSTPGWEDWDDDSQPGVSQTVAGIVAGTRYSANRTWLEWNGSIAADPASFKLPTLWSSDESILGVTSELLTAPSARAADPSLHYAQFARLTPDQAQGDAATICATVRQLAPSLTSEANQ